MADRKRIRYDSKTRTYYITHKGGWRKISRNAARTAVKTQGFLLEQPHGRAALGGEQAISFINRYQERAPTMSREAQERQTREYMRTRSQQQPYGTRSRYGSRTNPTAGGGETDIPGGEEDFLTDEDLGGGGGATGPSGEELAIMREQIAVQKQQLLSDAVNNIIQNRLADLASRRSAAEGVIREHGAMNTSAEGRGLLGRMLPGIRGGQPLEATTIPVDMAAFAEPDMAAISNDAVAQAKQMLGLASGGVIDEQPRRSLFRAADGIEIPKDLEAVLKAVLGNTDVLNTIASQFGIVPQQLVDAIMATYNVPPGTVKMGETLEAQKVKIAQAAQKTSEESLKLERDRYLADLMANPRRVIEAAYLQGGQAPTAAASAMQNAITPAEQNRVLPPAIPGVTPQPGTMPGAVAKQALPHDPSVPPIGSIDPRLVDPVRMGGGGLFRAALGYDTEPEGESAEAQPEGTGPAVILVGEGKNDEGIEMGTHEYILAPPGTVVAPGKPGEQPNMHTAMQAIQKQLRKSGYKEGSSMHEMLKMATGGYFRRAAVGASLTQDKAREILRHGEVRGHKLTKKQRGFFGARLRRAALGYTAADALKLLRAGNQAGALQMLKNIANYNEQADAAQSAMIKTTVQPGVAQAGKTALFDPFGGTRPELKGLMSGFGGGSGVATVAQANRMSKTQRGLLEAGISAAGGDPEDYWDRVERDFRGFGARTAVGQTARASRLFG